MSDLSSLTPEEKLLRLIKGVKAKKDMPHETLGIERPGQEERTGKFNYIGKAYKHLTPRVIENIIIITLIISAGYFVVSCLYPFLGNKAIDLGKYLPESIVLEQPQVSEENNLLEQYLGAVNRRRAFKSIDFTSGQLPLAASGDIAKDFVLVGIISGSSPQAIIEDKKSGKAYYVVKGQFIGQYMLEDILDGKIILKINGQSFEISI